ncbi:MAG: Smr/MutS family protein, partial [Desulfobacteraceae bacterium]|nr:Smr/MutS family protein [Desulfobacteraceae bacterium]
PDLLADYFYACIDAGIYSVRIVHGKGRGILKKRVQELLKKNPLVESYKNAPLEAGGWGATLVELKPRFK